MVAGEEACTVDPYGCTADPYLLGPAAADDTACSTVSDHDEAFLDVGDSDQALEKLQRDIAATELQLDIAAAERELSACLNGVDNSPDPDAEATDATEAYVEASAVEAEAAEEVVVEAAPEDNEASSASPCTPRKGTASEEELAEEPAIELTCTSSAEILEPLESFGETVPSDDDVEIINEDIVGDPVVFGTASGSQSFGAEASSDEEYSDGRETPRWLMHNDPLDRTISTDAEMCCDFLEGIPDDAEDERVEIEGACPRLSQYLIGHPQGLVTRKRKQPKAGGKRYFGGESQKSEDVMDAHVVTGCWACGKLDHESNECVFKRCFVCSGQGHEFSDCTRKKDWCTRCGRNGHSLDEDCPRIQYLDGLESMDEPIYCRCMACGKEGHVNCREAFAVNGYGCSSSSSGGRWNRNGFEAKGGAQPEWRRPWPQQHSQAPQPNGKGWRSNPLLGQTLSHEPRPPPWPPITKQAPSRPPQHDDENDEPISAMAPTSRYRRWRDDPGDTNIFHPPTPKAPLPDWKANLQKGGGKNGVAIAKWAPAPKRPCSRRSAEYDADAEDGLCSPSPSAEDDTGMATNSPDQEEAEEEEDDADADDADTRRPWANQNGWGKKPVGTANWGGGGGWRKGGGGSWGGNWNGGGGAIGAWGGGGSGNWTPRGGRKRKR